MVINLAVEGDDHIFCFVINGLTAALQIHKAETAKAHGNAVIQMRAVTVRPSVDDFIFH